MLIRHNIIRKKKLAENNMFLVCGMSGGGKTVLSERILDKNKELNLVFFDPDMYYAEINGDECIHENFFEVWIQMWIDIHNAEMEGKNVLISTNALTESQRTQFLEWFPSFKHHMIWVSAPKDICIKGNKARRRQVPADKFEKMWKRQEPPTNKEKWDTITEITNYWQDDYIIYKIKNNVKKLIKF